MWRLWSHFHDWIDCNRVTFLVELLEWGRTFWDFWDKKIVVSRDLKIGMVRAVVLIFNSRRALNLVFEITT